MLPRLTCIDMDRRMLVIQIGIGLYGADAQDYVGVRGYYALLWAPLTSKTVGWRAICYSPLLWVS